METVPSRSAISIPQLRQAFKSRVIAPGDDDYDRARTVFAGGIDRSPAVIIRPADAAEVARVIALARGTGLELAVRSGGHSASGHSVTDGGIVLDLHDMRALEIDVEGRTAWAEAGLTAGAEGAQALVLSGRPLGEPVVQHGPFVMNTQAQIEQALRDYRNDQLVVQR